MVFFLAHQSKDDLAVAARASRDREGHTGHRPDVSAERGCRGYPLPRSRTREGEVVITV
jgi:hypothetical protein